jgi:hypothetical protein
MKIISDDLDYEIIDDSDPDERQYPGERCKDCIEIYDSWQCMTCLEKEDIIEMRWALKEGEIW